MNTVEHRAGEKDPSYTRSVGRSLCLMGATSSLLLAATDLVFLSSDDFSLLPQGFSCFVWPLIALLLLQLSRTPSWTPPLPVLLLGWLLTTVVVVCSGFIPIIHSRGHFLPGSSSGATRLFWLYCNYITPILSLTAWTSAMAGLNLLGSRETLLQTLRRATLKGVILLLVAVSLFRGLIWLIRPHECNYSHYDGSVLLDSTTGSRTTLYNDKPVIYLYPKNRQRVDVRLSLLNGALSATYPTYDNDFGGWRVIAEPDGSLTDLSDKKRYSYLFWESVSTSVPAYDLSKGFIVKGSEIREFLVETLPKTGLTPKEYNEFIVYWYPRLMNIPLMQLHFAGAEYDRSAPLAINPQPDSLLRVFMVVKPLAHAVELEPQTFPHFERTGFSVVEWGGSVLPNEK
jgi:hypothetical protein